MPEGGSNPIEDGPVTEPLVAEPRPSMRERVDALRVRADTAKASLKETSDQLRARNATVQLAYEAYEDDRRQAGACSQVASHTGCSSGCSPRPSSSSRCSA